MTVFTGPSGEPPTKLVVGLVGYPNVGKSSTINALLGEKKVSVSSTPGKTKHFQTIHLSPTIVLCDCPGLVFPQFATTKAALVCDGVLPIDQMREHSGPTALVAKRIPKEVLEATYGLTIKTKGIEEGGDGKVTAEDFLIAYASELSSLDRMYSSHKFYSRPGVHAIRPRQPRRSSGSTIYSKRLCKWEATFLPFTARHTRGIFQPTDPRIIATANGRKEACTCDESRKRRGYICAA